MIGLTWARAAFCQNLRGRGFIRLTDGIGESHLRTVRAPDAVEVLVQPAIGTACSSDNQGFFALDGPSRALLT